MSKLVSSLREALEKAGLQSGMTISFGSLVSGESN